MKKKLVVVLVLLMLASSAFAWVWLVQGARWALTSLSASRVAFATNTGLRAATAKSLSLHATVGGLMFAGMEVINNPPPSSKVPAHVMIDLSNSPQRQNPDPNRYNDAAAGQVDPTPKTSFDPFATLPVLPSSWADVVTDMGAPAYKLYRNSTNTTLHKIVTSEFQIGYRPGAAGTTTAAIPSALPDDANYPRVASIKTTTTSCGSSSESSPNCVYVGVYRYTETKTCPDGYTVSGTTCNLANASSVKKPEKTVPCEVVQVNGVYEMDWSNPECNTVSNAGNIRTVNANTVELSNAAESLTSSCGTAGCEMVYKDKADDSWVKYTTGPADSNGSREVTAIENGTGTAPTPGVPGGGGTDPGDGGDGGDTGPGCTEGEPCHVKVDDSGFKDLDTGLENIDDKAQEHFDQMMEKAEGVTFDETHGLEWDWVPQLPTGSCSPIRYGIDDRYIEIDLCEKFEVIRNVLSWILYIYTGMYILDLFLSSAYPTYYTSRLSNKRVKF